MYNRYQGNSGRVQRVNDKPKVPELKNHIQPPPLKKLGDTGFPLKGILPKGLPELEAEDLILLLVLYLMYRKSGDSDLLIMMGAMFLL